MSHPIILDLETQYTFQEVKFDYKKLKVSVVGIYDYATDSFETYFERELNRLFTRLEHASFVVGFNIKKFDFEVLSPYYLGNIAQFQTLDLLEEVEKNLGYRVALDDLARATLGTKKSGHGFIAIDYFKNGELEKLKKYCLDDVRITKELYEFGKNHKEVLFLTNRGIKKIPVAFDKDHHKTSVPLSLPF